MGSTGSGCRFPSVRARKPDKTVNLDIPDNIGFGVSEVLTDPIKNGFVCVHGEDGERVE